MHINHITYELAENFFSLQDLAALHQISASEAMVYQKIMGLNEVPRYTQGAVDQQLSSVIKKFLQETKINTDEVKYILFAHTSEHVAPLSVTLLQELVNVYLFKNAIAFGVTINKCASAFQLLNIASHFFESLHSSQKILIWIADIAFTKTLYSIKETTVFGDAACVLLLQKQNDRNHFIDCLLKIDDRFAAGTYADHNEFSVFKFLYASTLAELITEIVEKNHISLNQIKYIFPNNVNTLSWRLIAEQLHFPLKKIYLKNVARTAHCFGSDPFINLQDAINAHELNAGDFYLLVTAGLGATFAAILLKY